MSDINPVISVEERSSRGFLCAGEAIYDFAQEIFPICRSITGDGVRKTLSVMKQELPSLQIHEVKSGTKCFDWEVPKEWNPHGAWIEDEGGNCVVDFAENNIHLMGYSVPFDGVVSLEELQEHLYSLPQQPNAIPYVTSYYKERWGFCIAHEQLKTLRHGNYRVRIDTELKHGSLSYGEILLRGENSSEVLLSTYICHPSLANDNISGPALLVHLAKWLESKPRRHTYRIIFIPETIGSIVYLSRHLEELKKNVIAGYVLTCVGDNRAYSFLPSRNGNSLSDRVARKILRDIAPDFIEYSFLTRGADERQFCSPNVDLPVASVMRSKYDEFTEYHTSLDDMNLISKEGFQGSYDIYTRIIEAMEGNDFYRAKYPCEPQLGKRGLYPTTSVKGSFMSAQNLLNFIAYCDGERDIVEISDVIGISFEECARYARQLRDAGVIEVITQ